MKFFIALVSVVLLQTSLGYGAQALLTPSNPGTSTLGYTCTDEDGDRKCVCTGVSDCNRMKESGICRRQTGAHVWEDDFNCNDATNTCTCTWPLEGQGGQRRPNRFGGDEKMAPNDNGKVSRRLQEFGAAATFEDHVGVEQSTTTVQNTHDDITSPGNRSSRRNENVIARRGKTSTQSAENSVTEEMKREAEEMEDQLREIERGVGECDNLSSSASPVGNGVDSAAATISDPILDTLEPAAGEVGESVGGFVESIEDAFDDLINGDSDDERDPIVDHRTGRKPPKQRRTETVPARRGKLAAPTNVTLTDCNSNSLVIRWHDNAKSEYGVHVERGAPANAGGKSRIAWRRIFSSEERVDDRIRGIGERSDVDDNLTPGVRYCYRLQAYRPNSVSDYSEIACTTLR